MKRVVLCSNPYRDKNFRTVRQAEKLLHEAGIETSVCLAFDAERSCELPKDLQFVELEPELRRSELLICFGGDGTLLHTSKAATRAGIPVLGVNIGNMGFLAEVDSSELPLLKQLARGDYTIERRMMLDVQATRDGAVIYRDIALNDATVTKGAMARTIHLSVGIDQPQTEGLSLHGDGVIICTPTGSTAYSMSAGGPIVEPTAHNTIITPICVHDLMSKAFVMDARRTVYVKVCRIGRKNAYLSVDGGRSFRLNAGDAVVLRQSRLETQLLRLKKRNMFEILNSKFMNR